MSIKYPGSGAGYNMKIKKILEGLYAERSSEHLANDPLSFCHKYEDPRDQEVVGLIASAFAYGNVKAILASLESIFSSFSITPRRYIEKFETASGLKKFAGFKYRFHDGRDLCALLMAIKMMLEKSDSIENFFLSGHSSEASDITKSLTDFTAAVLAFDYSAIFPSSSISSKSYFPLFFPSPADGSACKRLCMYLRWVVRPADGIDLGLWKSISPAQLVVPVDAHIQRISRFLGFTCRRQADWRMAREVTAALRLLDPDDPVKYDFSLCHLGISEGCDGTNREACLKCAVSDVCRGRVS
jgi:uncharacterized protein (TIGR02757 family)